MHLYRQQCIPSGPRGFVWKNLVRCRQGCLTCQGWNLERHYHLLSRCLDQQFVCRGSVHYPSGKINWNLAWFCLPLQSVIEHLVRNTLRYSTSLCPTLSPLCMVSSINTDVHLGKINSDQIDFRSDVRGGYRGCSCVKAEILAYDYLLL